jgi:hypothetical protein
VLNKLTKYTYYRDGCAVAHSKTLINTGVSKDLPRNQAKKTEATQVAVKFFGNADKHRDFRPATAQPLLYIYMRQRDFNN